MMHSIEQRGVAEIELRVRLTQWKKRSLVLIIFLILSTIIIVTVNHYKKITTQSSLQTITQTYKEIRKIDD